MVDMLCSVSYSYEEYIDLVKNCVEKGVTTGLDVSVQKVEATKMNLQRMTRISKQLVLNADIIKLVQDLKSNMKWLVITEAWCGDGAQIIPIISKVSSLSNKIELEIVLRDENPDLIRKYHTNNSLSIPKLICFDSNTGKELGVWGPRPLKIAEKVKELKLSNPEMNHDDFVKEVQVIYNKDKGVSTIEDLMNCISIWKEG